MELQSSDSVFEMITELSVKFLNTSKRRVRNDNIKQLRSRAYEILLSKRIPTNQGSMLMLPETSDSYYQMLAWQLTVAKDFNLPDKSKSIGKCVEYLKNCEVFDTEILQSILLILLKIRGDPYGDEHSLNHTTKQDCFYRQFSNRDFQLPSAFICANAKYNNESFQLFKQPTRFTAIQTLWNAKRGNRKSCAAIQMKEDTEAKADEGYESNSKVNSLDDVWEIASKTKLSNRKTWENFGAGAPEKEWPFLTEVKPEVVNHLHELVCIERYAVGDMMKTNKITTRENFIKDVRNVLVGIPSTSFVYDDTEKLILVPNITIDGISRPVLEAYCADMIYCGNMYNSLIRVVAIDRCTTLHYKQSGYIYAEFYRGVNRYLSYYRIVALASRLSTGFLALQYNICQLKQQLIMLSRVCKSVSYSESPGISQGVVLLNRLYETVVNHESTLFLCGILQRCLQVYFSQFLMQWVLEGSVYDVHNEFFVSTTHKYLSCYGRPYWTRSFLLRDETVPTFLKHFGTPVLNCGKAISLLKLCNPNSPIFASLNAHKSNLLQCCFTAGQLKRLDIDVTAYRIEVLTKIGPKFSIEQFLRIEREQEFEFLNLVAAKREITLKRLEAEKLKKLEIMREKKESAQRWLKEQFDSALKENQRIRALELQKEMAFLDEQERLRNLEKEIIQEEVDSLIQYYDKLYEQLDRKREAILKHTEILKIQLEEKESTCITESMSSSSETFFTPAVSSTEVHENNHMHTSKSLDILNANIGEINDNETGKMKCKTEITLTEAQRNKMRVLGSEFNIITMPAEIIKKKETTITEAQRNKLKVMGTKIGYMNNPPKCDNENYLNDNKFNEYDETDIVPKSAPQLTLDLESFGSKKHSLFANCMKSPNFEFARPMSIGSTPVTDISPTSRYLSTPETGATNITEDFDFEKRDNISGMPVVACTNLSELDPDEVALRCLRQFITQSLSVPLLAQTYLVENELMKYFVQNLQYLEHLKSLRDYFFLQDGEFGRNITENLFEKLYDVRSPAELFHYQTLQHLMDAALSATRSNSSLVSIKAVEAPKKFLVRDVEVFDCLSLTYQIDWPLNILLPPETIKRYNEIFKFLLKLHRVTWVLKKIFSEFKMLGKEVGDRRGFLMLSPQYRHLEHARHVMTHVIQALQSYVVREALQSSWTAFEEELKSARNLDDMYLFHTNYIKAMLFKCMLNRRFQIEKTLLAIFSIVLRFYDYLRSRQWQFDEDAFVHPNYSKLSDIFSNFLEFVHHLFKSLQKIVKNGCLPTAAHLVEMLDINDFFGRKLSAS